MADFWYRIQAVTDEEVMEEHDIYGTTNARTEYKKYVRKYAKSRETKVSLDMANVLQNSKTVYSTVEST